MYLKRNKHLDVVALFLGDYKEQFYLREISKLAKIPLKTTQNIMQNLEGSKVLQSHISGKNKYFSLNLNNPQAKLLILQAELHKTAIFLEKYLIFKTFVKEIITDAPVIVFGSLAKFRANKDSDLDLLVISRKKYSLPFHLLDYKVHQILLSEAAFIKALNKQEALIKEVEANHIILNNHSFYVNVLWSYYGNK